MKKTFLLLMAPLALACGSLSAQTYLSQDFESGMGSWTATPSTGWTLPCVTSTYFNPGAHTTYVGINDDAVQTASNPNSILETPVVNLSAATTVFLKYDCFYGHGSNNSVFEDCNVYYSTNGGVTYTLAHTMPVTTGPWITNSVNMTAQLAGQANVKIKFGYNDNAEWEYGCGLDNVSLFAPSPNDVAMISLNPAAFSPASYGTVSSNITFTGTVQNAGTNTITALTLKYNDGTTTYSSNLSSLSIGSFANYNFTHSVPYTIPSAGPHPITFWVELTGDADHTNDTANTTVTGVAFIPTHAVTVEEATGTWCGWCVRGIVYLDSMNAVHPTTCNLIAVHNGDPMVVTAYDAGIGTIIAGYPSTVINGDLVSDPSAIFPDYDNSIADFGYADLTPTVSFNSTTRVATVVASAHFAVDLTGTYRLACVFTEEGVHSTAGGQWDQHNYYSTQSQNIPLVDLETGFDFQAAPSTIPSAQMYYGYVARTILGGFNGQTGSLPSTIPSGSTQTYTFTYTIPATYDYTKMKVTLLLIDNNNGRHIMNSAGAPVFVGIDAPSAIGSVNIFPNPANQNSNVNIHLLTNENVSVDVYDMTGALVSSQNEGVLAQGEHNVALNTMTLANGMYFVKVTAGQSVINTKVTVAH